MITTQYEQFESLLTEFDKLPIKKTTRTFMEVARYPHYENVCSNILAFYFDPAEEHGMGDLLLQSLLARLNKSCETSISAANVSREVLTNSGKRLDLLIETEGFVMGIENKIWAPLYNNLEDYAEKVVTVAKAKSIANTHLIVLTLNALSASEVARIRALGFKNITYQELIHETRNRLGHYAAAANAKFLNYFTDFMQTITNIGGQNMDLQKTDQFFIEHNDQIEKMLHERNAFMERLCHKVDKLQSLMTEANLQSPTLVHPPKIYGGNWLYLDFLFQDKYRIALDLPLFPSGWELQLFSRDSRSFPYLGTLLAQPALKERVGSPTMKNNRYILERWDISMPVEGIQSTLCEWVNVLIAADRSASS